MIDKVFKKFFGFLDAYSEWFDNTFFKHDKKCKCKICKCKNKIKKPSFEDFFNGE